jgi:hypothetical protein
MHDTERNKHEASSETPHQAKSTGLRTVGTIKLTNLSPWIISTVDRLSKTSPGDIQGIAGSQIELLSSYYDAVLGQAKESFRWALIAAGTGLAFFLAAVAFLLTDKSQNVAYISLISGGIIEAISGINFYLYRTTSVQLAEFHTRLDRTQRFLLANSLCETLEGDFRQNARLELIRTIAGIEVNKVENQQPPSD